MKKKFPHGSFFQNPKSDLLLRNGKHAACYRRLMDARGKLRLSFLEKKKEIPI